MIMAPRLRKFALTAHVISSVGWLGAVAGFLALAVAGLASPDAQLVRATYLAMELIARFVIVPFALAALLTGLVQSLGTTWGLFRHYRVLVKLVITVVATIVLLLQMGPIGYIAGVAAETTLASARSPRGEKFTRGPRWWRPADVARADDAVGVKPRGMTRYGRRKRHVQRPASQP